MTTIETLVPERLWQAIQPLLPTPPPRYGGRPRVDDRAALAGIVYQLRTGIPWRLLPTRQLGCGSPVTCWRRLRDWQRAGVWQQLNHHLLVDRRGIPLAAGLSAANTHDSMLLEAVVDAVPPIKGRRGRPGRPRRRPAKLHCDKGYDYPRCRRAPRPRGVTPPVAPRGGEASQRLGPHRYVVERSLAWLVGY